MLSHICVYGCPEELNLRSVSVSGETIPPFFFLVGYIIHESGTPHIYHLHDEYTIRHVTQASGGLWARVVRLRRRHCGVSLPERVSTPRR